MSKHILKIGLAVISDRGLLVVRKRATMTFILPGGKPEALESDTETLNRELDEELGCRIVPDSLVFLGTFTDIAADHTNTTVSVRLYHGSILGRPTPKAEIEELDWYFPFSMPEEMLAPSISRQILPYLLTTGHLRSATDRRRSIAANASSKRVPIFR